jgi:hypothetical protein
MAKLFSRRLTNKDYQPCKCGKLPKFFCRVFSIRPIYDCMKPMTLEDLREEERLAEEAKNKK